MLDNRRMNERPCLMIHTTDIFVFAHLIRWHCDGNRRKRKMKRENWDCYIRRCPGNHNNNSKQLENNNLKIIFNHRAAIIRACHHLTMIMSLANEFISVAANQVCEFQWHFPFNLFDSTMHVCVQYVLENSNCSIKNDLTCNITKIFSTDVESHHQRIRSDRTGTTYSPERIDNESPGEWFLFISFHFFSSSERITLLQINAIYFLFCKSQIITLSRHYENCN